MEKINIYCGKVNSQGGSKISLLNLIFLLSQENKKINVFVSERGWFTKQLDEKNIKYTLIKEPMCIKRINQKTNILFKLLFAVFSMPRLFRNWMKVNKILGGDDKVILNENRDLILFLPALFSKKIEVIQWIRSEYAGRLTRIIMRFADKIVVVSDIVYKNISKLTNRPIYRVHNFMIDQPKNIKEKSVEKSRINIAVVGSIQKIKGQLDAVKVLEKLKSENKITLHIIGRQFDENYTHVIKDYISKRDLKNQIKFIGHIDNVTDYLNENIHLTLIPSQTESFCRVAMESISVGIPVVAYRVGGLREVILENQTGILVNKDNISEMAKSVNGLLSNQSFYSTMSTNGIVDWKERFYSESIKEQLFEILG